jgi:hypothetical protein
VIVLAEELRARRLRAEPNVVNIAAAKDREASTAPESPITA